MTHPHDQFPYGLYEVPDYDSLCTRYAHEVPALAKYAPLPTHLPRRHPVLERLQGTFRVHDTLPPWWQSCVSELIRVCPCLRPLLCTLSREEFRQGTIEQRRWRAWRTTRCQHQPSGEEHPVPCWQHYGPGLYWMLDKVLPPTEQKRDWMDQFVNRGNKAMPAALDLVITADPAWWLNMSNGCGWYTCMGSGDDRDPRIIGNWYDTGVLLAAFVARGADCWTPESLIARTTVRLVEARLAGRDTRTRHEKQEPSAAEPGAAPVYRLALGRVYHNDMTAACNLLLHLAQLCEERRLAWGCIGDTNALHLAQNGLLGPIQVDETAVPVSGVSFWRPEDVETPYLDGEAFFREADEREQEGYRACPSLTVYPCCLPPSDKAVALAWVIESIEGTTDATDALCIPSRLHVEPATQPGQTIQPDVPDGLPTNGEGM